MKIKKSHLRRLIREELSHKLLKESTQRYCEIWLASNGKWYLNLADEEYGEYHDAITYGPFNSEQAADDHIQNFSNPGGLSVDDSGEEAPPTQSPNGQPVVNPRSSRRSSYGGYGRGHY